jgi:hypothetical protein
MLWASCFFANYLMVSSSDRQSSFYPNTLFYHEGHEEHEEYTGKSIFMSFMSFMVLNRKKTGCMKHIQPACLRFS